MSALFLARDLRRRALQGATLLFTSLFALGSLMGLVPLLTWTEPMAFFAPFMVFVGSAIANRLAARARWTAASQLFSATLVTYVAAVMIVAGPVIRTGIGFPFAMLVLFLVHLVQPTERARPLGWMVVGSVLLGAPTLLLWPDADWMVFTATVVQALVSIFANLVLSRLGEAWIQALMENDHAREELAEALEYTSDISRSKSAFLASMSHELRTPLNAIIGYAEMLKEDVEDEVLPKAADLERIHTSGTLLLKLVNQVLDLSKVESGRMQLELTPVDLKKVLGQVADTLALTVEAHGNRFDVRLDAVPTLQLDDLRVRQIVTNLLSNAAKFTEAGTVGLHLRHATEHVVVEVRDTGIGIPEERQRRIFEPFVQASETTNRTHGGTGLGLAIARGLTEEMGGRVELESTPGEGSTFRLLFPVQAPTR